MHQYLEEKGHFNRLAIIAAIVILLALSTGAIYWLTRPTIPAHFSALQTLSEYQQAKSIKGFGTIVPRHKLVLSAMEAGLVTEVLIRPGQQVQQGQKLARIVNHQLEQDVQKASYELLSVQSDAQLQQSELQIRAYQYQADLNRADTALKKQQLELDANRQLAESGVVSKIKFAQEQMNVEQLRLEQQAAARQLSLFEDSRQEQLRALQMKVSAAEQRLTFLQARLDALSVYASIDGIARNLEVSVGQRVSQGQSLMELVDTAELIAEIQVPQYSAGQMALGLAATVRTPGGQVAAVVEHIDSVIRNGAISVFLTLSQRPAWLKTDQSVEAHIETGVSQSLLVLHRPDNFQQYPAWSLYQVDNQQARRSAATISEGPDQLLVVTGNLQQGQQVLLLPTALVSSEEFSL